MLSKNQIRLNFVNKLSHRKSGAGFTLIELLVVIAIISLLASVVLVATNSARGQARDSQRVANINQLKTALDLYYNDHNSYPIGTYYSGWDFGNYSASDHNCWCRSTASEGGFEQGLVAGAYISKLPEDPTPREGYGNYLDGQGTGYLYVSPDGQNYVLGTYLETANTPPPATNTATDCIVAGNYQVSVGNFVNPDTVCPQPYTTGFNPPPPTVTPTNIPPPPTITPPPPTVTPPVTSCGGNEYLHCRTLTFDHNKAGSSDTVNFVALIHGSYSYLFPSGGEIQHTTTQPTGSYTGTVPADLIFTSDSACSNKLKWEFETYDSSAGMFNVWVNIGTLSHTADTTVYMCYDNSSIAGWQGNVNGTWDSNYKGVYHYSETPGTGVTVHDSTSNSNNQTANVNAGYWSSADLVAGQIDGAWNYETNFQWNSTFGTGLNAPLAGSPFTFEFWINPNSLGTYREIFSNLASNNGIIISTDASVGSGLEVFLRPGIDRVAGSTGNLSIGNWTDVVVTYDNVDTIKIYYNGSLKDTITGIGANAVGASSQTAPNIGNGLAWGGNALQAELDDLRISSTNRDSGGTGYITASYNNQLSPNSFYTIGSEQ